MLLASLWLFSTLGGSRQSLTRMMLVGVVFSVLFRSLNNLLQQMIDPNAFAIVQGVSFAQFTSVKGELLWFGVALALASAVWIYQKSSQLDLLLLGRDRAISLGVDYPRFSKQILLCCALLVSVATALVGPILFLGLLVCAITHLISPRLHHQVRVPMVFLIGAITLVGGQFLFEQVLHLRAVVSVVIEFIGGIVFIGLMLHQRKKVHYD